MNKAIFHGECVITQIDELPARLKKVESTGDYVRIAESEVTGNHHQVLVKDKDIEFYERDGVLYATVNEPTTINCVLAERHDDIVLPMGLWKFEKALEYDPLSNMESLQYVKD